ncbi:hypothetical protein LP414_21325 [Polaromonas sp. P1(28)-13]|nr:hypothetical protein LP414_21325 [Polaromonas sp. P1(28)-13]
MNCRTVGHRAAPMAAPPRAPSRWASAFRNFYAAYERSISGALGTLYIFYDLSQRFTVRAQTGQQSAVDLIFTVPYD